ncbi:hypothetical protein ADMFC3_12320 [Geovibrio sp. ADMFC3]|jgi:hypothetical protein
MCDCRKNIKVNESYTSFKNINCFENACLVVDNLLRVLKETDTSNAFWDKFISLIPQAYYERDPKLDSRETLLYIVCKNAPFLMDFFEEKDDEEAIHAMTKCEQECC